MTTHLPPYPAYRDSGIEWLGAIPQHWVFSTIRRYCDVFAGATPSRAVMKFWENGTIPWLSSGDVNLRIIYKTSQFITEAGFAASSTKWIRPQSIVLALAGQGRTKGMIATVEIAATCNQSLAVIEPFLERLNHQYLAYYLESKYLDLRSLVGDGLRDGLNLEHVKSIVIPLPPLTEQAAIVRYLDAADQRIRRYIRAKQRLIAVLNEQKQGIIQQAVTRGLDPDVPLKPSGVAWLGDIPAHWEAKRIKRISTINPSRSSVQAMKDSAEMVVFLPMERVSNTGNADYSERRPVSDVWEGFTFFQRGDVLLAKITPCFENGKGAYVGDMPTCIGFGTTEFIVLRAHAGVMPQFLHRITQVSTFKKLGKESMTGSAGQQRVPASFVEQFYMPVPPLVEQSAILDVISKNTLSIEDAASALQNSIATIREYRTRLIADVVTGKIDVRAAVYHLPNIFVDDLALTDLPGELNDDDRDIEFDADALNEDEGNENGYE